MRLLIIIFLFISLFFSCKNIHRNKSHKDVSAVSIREGETLANRFCQSCHQLPDPSLLDSKTWEGGVLPLMAPRLGIFSHGFTQYPSSRYDKNLDTNFYPSQPLLNDDEWQHIIDYYTATSPDSLEGQVREKKIITGLPLFQVQATNFRLLPPATCLVKIDTTSVNHSLLFADFITKGIYRLNNRLQCIDSAFSTGPVVNVQLGKDSLLICDIGEMNPTNAKYGTARYIRLDGPGFIKSDTIALLGGLARPVQVTAIDLNADGKKDYLACEFGYITGSLSCYINKGNNTFQRKVIRNLPGAISAYIQDYNKDGLPDLWVLFAQGEEGVFLFTNKGDGHFEEQQVLRLPPIYGSTSFELVDFNKDGYQDIIYTCGDNADYSRVLKPYHGVYVFLNDGNNHFTQNFFFPVNGCYKALARDFDNDGDIDIAAISYFADYARQPEEGFVYLENQGEKGFQPYTLPEAKNGRWLCMDAGDLDGDGKIDLVLGNFSVGPVVIKSATDWQQGPCVLFLKNIGRSNK